MSHKNTLQEYCQKHKIDLPSYSTSRVGEQTFVSVVMINGKEYKGEVKTRKTHAEISAASIALDDINKRCNTRKIILLDNSYKVGIFIDCENKQKIFDDLNDKIDLQLYKNIEIHLFLSKYHDLSKKIISYKNCIKYLTDSVAKDAADIHLIFSLSKLIDRYHRVIIVSSDHYAKTLSDIINKEGEVEAFTCLDIDEIIECLEH